MTHPCRFLSPFLPFLLPVIAQASDFRITGLALGFGDWINVTDGDWDTREDYGTLPAASLYWTGGVWNGSLGIPVKSSFKRIGHKARIALGDGEVSLGRKSGTFSPRISLKLPLYTWSADRAGENELYIGSGTWDVALGLGGRLFRGRLPERLILNFDLEASTVVMPGLADLGSSHGMGMFQAAYALGKRWKAGAKALFLFDHWIWIPDFWDQEGETKFAIVPGAVAGVRLFRSTYVDLKAGWSAYEFRRMVEPKYAVLPQSSYHFGVSLYHGFQ